MNQILDMKLNKRVKIQKRKVDQTKKWKKGGKRKQKAYVKF